MHFGQIRAALERSGKVIGPNDFMIAAGQGLTLVTDNAREFERIPGPVIENWVR